MSHNVWFTADTHFELVGSIDDAILRLSGWNGEGL